MSTAPFPSLITDYLARLRLEDRASTAGAYTWHLRKLQAWATAADVDLERVSTDLLHDFQRWVADEYRDPRGKPLSAATRATVLATVKALYGWAYRRRRVLTNPAVAIDYPHLPVRNRVTADHLTQQEAIAFIQTQAAIVVEHQTGSRSWAGEVRHLAMLCLALGTARRSHGLLAIRVDELDLDRCELRVPTEKSRIGSVLPVPAWAMNECRRYLTEARPLLPHAVSSPFLFVGHTGPSVSASAYGCLVHRVTAETCRRNPDLVDLPAKRISTHSLRTTFATMALSSGVSLAALTRLMLHARPDCTRLYSALGVEDVRAAVHAHHPLAGG
jgi:site-specific recombinase XerD